MSLQGGIADLESLIELDELLGHLRCVLWLLVAFELLDFLLLLFDLHLQSGLGRLGDFDRVVAIVLQSIEFFDADLQDAGSWLARIGA